MMLTRMCLRLLVESGIDLIHYALERRSPACSDYRQGLDTHLDIPVIVSSGPKTDLYLNVDSVPVSSSPKSV